MSTLDALDFVEGSSAEQETDTGQSRIPSVIFKNMLTLFFLLMHYLIYLSFSEILSLKAESATVQSLKDEFTQRIADAERKAQVACKERDIAKKVIYYCCLCILYL